MSMHGCGTTVQLGVRGSPEPGEPREAAPKGKILIAATRCRRKVGREGGTKKHTELLQVHHSMQLMPAGSEFRLTHRDRNDRSLALDYLFFLRVRKLTFFQRFSFGWEGKGDTFVLAEMN